MIILTITTQSALCQTQHNTWRGNPYSASLTALMLITLQMVDQRSVEMLAFNFVSRTFAYKRFAQGLSKSVSAFSSFMREYLDQLSRLTNVLNTWMILESQPITLWTLPGTFGHSSSAFAMQD